MDMFKKYDADGSGEIDKTEFRAIAKEIQADARRRNLISVAAAAVGAVSIYACMGVYTQIIIKQYILDLNHHLPFPSLLTG